jgi:heme/copper-type cytochrome/quinol oxidase subunit 3
VTVSATITPIGTRHAERTAMLGMVIFTASWAMLFAMLFLSYLVLRVRATAWPPPELPRLPLGLPALATVALGLSSVALQRGAARGGGRLIGLAALGAMIFLALQAVVWRQMYLAGLRPGSGPYASVFFGLTVFHALHVLVGLGALGWLSVRPAAVRLWAVYWHMVGIIWAVMFTLVYLL